MKQNKLTLRMFFSFYHRSFPFFKKYAAGKQHLFMNHSQNFIKIK